MIRRPPRSTLSSSSAASDVYKRQALGLCSNAPAAERISPFGGYTNPDSIDEGNAAPYPPNDAEVTAQNDLDLEILLRGNLLQQQQQRISILETSLSSMCNEIQRYREQLQDIESDKSGGHKPRSKVQSRYWTAEEHHTFLVGLQKYGPRDVKSIAALVGTRNATQVRTHAQKYFLRVARETGDDEADECNPAPSVRKRTAAEALEASTAALCAGKSSELKQPQDPPSDDAEYEAGFGAGIASELGEFGASLEISAAVEGLGGDSPLRAFDEALSKGPILKRMKESFERNSRSVSPSRIDALGDLEEVDAENVAGIYEQVTAR
eukprot:TRINITY_DN630_c0_g1_i1.p1 TRINITY_DN630_c0_g1~~TRINITY_DN630_c0_g1_i1.p1  ORF type:complete len:323 (+),score=98.37 TRINITY_DN630_c0_g1_i1:97-1065(+)